MVGVPELLCAQRLRRSRALPWFSFNTVAGCDAASGLRSNSEGTACKPCMVSRSSPNCTDWALEKAQLCGRRLFLATRFSLLPFSLNTKKWAKSEKKRSCTNDLSGQKPNPSTKTNKGFAGLLYKGLEPNILRGLKYKVVDHGIEKR